VTNGSLLACYFLPLRPSPLSFMRAASCTPQPGPSCAYGLTYCCRLRCPAHTPTATTTTHLPILPHRASVRTVGRVAALPFCCAYAGSLLCDGYRVLRATVTFLFRMCAQDNRRLPGVGWLLATITAWFSAGVLFCRRLLHILFLHVGFPYAEDCAPGGCSVQAAAFAWAFQHCWWFGGFGWFSVFAQV